MLPLHDQRNLNEENKAKYEKQKQAIIPAKSSYYQLLFLELCISPGAPDFNLSIVKNHWLYECNQM